MLTIDQINIATDFIYGLKDKQKISKTSLLNILRNGFDEINCKDFRLIIDYIFSSEFEVTIKDVHRSFLDFVTLAINEVLIESLYEDD
ncbi:MAG: hypothetical protein H6630_08895 [Arcobacter sp.]|nr:hypothetical protein [Arcobacter sp.]